MHDCESKNTSCMSMKGLDSKLKIQSITVDKNDLGRSNCTFQSNLDLEQNDAIVPLFKPLPDRFAFSFNVANDKSGEDVIEKNSQDLKLSFGEELQTKSDNDLKVNKKKVKGKKKKIKTGKDLNNRVFDKKLKKKKTNRKVIKSILDDLLNHVHEVLMVKRIKTLCSRGEKESLKSFLSQTQNITPRALSEPLNEIVCKSAQFFDISKILLDHGASVDCQDEDGNTALHYAVPFYPTNKQTVDLLLERGSKTTIKNKLGYTPVVLTDDSELKALMKELKQPKNRTKLAIKKIVNRFKIVPPHKRIIIEEEHFPTSSPSILKKRKRSITSESPTKRIKLSDKNEYFYLFD